MMRRLALPAARARRWYATEAEYMLELKQGPAVGQLFQSKQPFLCHFTSRAMPQLAGHNKAVQEAMKGVNKGDVLIKYLVADLEERMSSELMRQLQIPQAPALAAFSEGRLLDNLVGMSNDEQIKGFITRFLSFTGKGDPAQPEMADIDGDGIDARFARFVIENKKVGKEPKDVITELTALIKDGEAQIAEEKKEKKVAQKKDPAGAIPTATVAQETVANAYLVLAETYLEIGESKSARAAVTAVQKDYAKFKLPTVVKSLNMLEMSLLTDYDGKPAHHYAQQVVSNPEDITLQLRLAVAMFKESQFKESIALMLQVLKKHRNHQDGMPKKLLVAAFAVLGPQNDITKEGQKKMMAYLF